MSDNNLRLQEVLEAADKLPSTFNDASRRTQSLVRDLNDLSRQAGQLNETINQLTAFRASQQQLKAMSQTLLEAQHELEQLTVKMNALQQPLNADNHQLQQAVAHLQSLQQAYTALSQHLAAQRQSLRDTGIDTRLLAEGQETLRRQTDHSTQSLLRQQKQLQELKQVQSERPALAERLNQAHETLSGVADGVLGQVNHAINNAADYDKQKQILINQGITQQQLMSADRFAQGQDITGNSAADNLDSLNQALSVLHDFKQSLAVAPLLGQVKFASRALNLPEDSQATLRQQIPQLLEIAQLRETLQDTQLLQQAISRNMQAIVASHGQGMPKDYLALAQAGGEATRKMSDQAFYFSLSGFMQQNGAKQTGSALEGAYRDIYQGQSSAEAMRARQQLGLVDRQQQGKGHEGGLVNRQLYQADPFHYLMTEILPRIQQSQPGVNDKGIEQAISRLFSTPSSQSLFVEMYRQREAIQQQVTRGQASAGTAQLNDAGQQSLPGQQLIMQNRINDLYQQMGKDILPIYLAVLQKVSDVLHGITSSLREHPQLSKSVAEGFALFGVAAKVLSVLSQGIGHVINSLNTLKNHIGQIADGIRKGFTSISQVISRVARLSARGFSLLASGARTAGSVISRAFMLLGRVVMVAGEMMLANPILAIIAAIAVGAILIWKNWDTLGPKFKKLWETFSAQISKIWLKVTDLAGKFKEVGQTFIKNLISGITDKWQALKQRIASLMKLIPDFLKPSHWVSGQDEEKATTDRHPKSVPLAAGQPLALAAMGGGQGMVFKPVMNTSINVYAQPHQDPQQIAQEVKKALEQHQRANLANTRSSYSDRGGYDLCS